MLSNLVLAEPQAKLKSGRVSSGQGVRRELLLAVTLSVWLWAWLHIDWNQTAKQITIYLFIWPSV